MEVLENQTILIKSLVRQQTDVNFIRSHFPIKTEDEFEAVDNEINEDNRTFYLDAMKSLMRGKPKKKLLSILNEDLIVNFNVDGTHGKRRLKDFTNFYPVLEDAFSTLEDSDPEEVIRKAFQAVKKQHFNVECLRRKQN